MVRPRLVYCTRHAEPTNAWTAQKLMNMGYTKVYALKGGWHEWFRAKYPTEAK